MSAAERRAGYLDELGSLLQQLTPVERIGVVDAVRTRIDADFHALGHEPTDADAVRILDEIGSPGEVADRAIAGEPALPAAVAPEPTPPAPSSTPTTPTTPREPRERATLAQIPAMEWPEDAPPRPGLTRVWLPLVAVAGILFGSFFLLFLIPAVLLGLGIWVLWASPLWTSREKLIGSIVPPIFIGSFLPVSALVFGSDGVPIPFLLIPLIGLGTLAWVGRRGFKAAREIDTQFPKPARR